MGIRLAIKQRKLFQWIAAYIAVACVAFQLTEAIGGIWSWPQALQRGITIVVGLGVLPSAVIAWYHGEKGRQAVCVAELGIVALLVASSVLVAWRLSS